MSFWKRPALTLLAISCKIRGRPVTFWLTRSVQHSWQPAWLVADGLWMEMRTTRYGKVRASLQAIADSQLSASSSYYGEDPQAISAGRLHTNEGGGAWCAGSNDSHQFLQIDLGGRRLSWRRGEGSRRDPPPAVPPWRLQPQGPTGGAAEMATKVPIPLLLPCGTAPGGQTLFAI